MLILFLLGALQGLVGWIMVQSGLENSELLYVSHYKLAIHFILALGLLCYTLWFALQLLVPANQITINQIIAIIYRLADCITDITTDLWRFYGRVESSCCCPNLADY